MIKDELNRIIEASRVEVFLPSVESKVSLPFIDEPANAGKALPFLNEDLFVKELDLNDEFIDQPANNFLFRVSGDSMEPDIEDGCLVVVDTLKQCRNGNIVIVAIDGSLVIKRYIVHAGRVVLHSSNPHYNDIVLTEFSDAKIWGVVVSKHVSV